MRIFLVSILVCAVFGSRAPQPLQTVPRMILFDATPFGFLMLFVRRVMPTYRFRSAGKALAFRSVVYTLVFVVAIELAAMSLPNGNEINESALKSPAQFVLALFGFYVWVLGILGTRGIVRKLGRGEFWNWVRGY